MEIPDKTYFKIGEAAKLVGVKPYIIRYWESEFRGLRPAKTKSRQRLFRRKDIELLLLIKTLLYQQKFTIEGARQQLKRMTSNGASAGELLDAIEPDSTIVAVTDDEDTDASVPAASAAVVVEPPHELIRERDELAKASSEASARAMQAEKRAVSAEQKAQDAERALARIGELEQVISDLRKKNEVLRQQVRTIASDMRRQWLELLSRSGVQDR